MTKHSICFVSLVLGVFICPSPLLASQFDCLIEPTQSIELAAPVTGAVNQVLVHRGDRVIKGQVLATLESGTEQAAMNLARFKSQMLGPAQLATQKIEFGRRKFNRRRDMAAEKLIPQQEKDDAEAEFKLAEAELAVANENREVARLEYLQQNSVLSLRTLRSPFDGVVVDQLAHPGEVVESSGNKKIILKLAQLNPLRVNVVLPKELFGKVTPGKSMDIVPEILAKKYSAKVVMVDRLIDAGSGTFVVFLSLPNPKLEIPSGLKCRANVSDAPIETSAKNPAKKH